MKDQRLPTKIIREAYIILYKNIYNMAIFIDFGSCMRIWAVSFLIGMLSLSLFKAISYAIPIAICACILALGVRKHAWLVAVLLGFSWMVFNAYSHFKIAQYLPENKAITVTGYVTSLPERQANNTRFEFRTVSNQRIRLNWAESPIELSPGDLLKLEMKLKKPHSYMNKNSFDYERWSFQQGIHAVGYVLPKKQYQRLGQGDWRFFVQRMRQHLQSKIEKNLAGRPLAGMISGLIIGVRSNITPDQWQVMQATGTNHLMAISGLHIGFIAGFAFGTVSWLWRRSARLPLWLPAPQAGAIGALIAAILYSGLAGFSLPTQRAVIMVGAVLLSLIFRRQLPPWQSWCLALLVILIFDPVAVLSDSFWLSFGAVAVILYGVGGRLAPSGVWWKWGRVQWVVSLGLAPLTLLLFQQVSIIGVLANLIAIPWVGFIVLPLCFIYWKWAEVALQGLWGILEWLAEIPYMQLQIPISNIALMLSIIGILLLLAPRGTPGRWIGIIWMMPLFLWRPAAPQPGELWLTLLDVGQGLAVVVRTPNHMLLYDTGMRYGLEFDNGFDMGKSVITPFLKSEGIKTIDKLVISHGDMDHIGGAKAILREFTVKAISSSVPERFSTYHSQSCQAGLQWVWDGVIFEFLYPPKNYIKKRINDDSCVLRISYGKHRILLPGDIERAGERYLLDNFPPEDLKADILVVPHHGSRTSSTPDFVKTVNPTYALFAVGYLNRYRHPNAGVVERYKAIKSNLYFTSDSGAISFIIKENLTIDPPVQYRIDKGYYWNKR